MAKKRNKKRGNFKSKVRRDTERQKSARSSYGYLQLPQNVSVFSPAPGSRTKLDFLPYIVSSEEHPDRYEDELIAVPGELWYKRPFRIHRNIGAESTSVVCPRSIGKRCPICEYREKRMKEGADKDETDSLRASHRNLYVVVPLTSKDHEAKPHIMDISQHLFQNLLNEELEEDEDNAVFPDLEEGKTLKVRWDSKTIGKSQPFAEASRIDFMDRKKGYKDDILDSVPDLDKLLTIMPYKELEAMFLELDEEDLAGEEDEVMEETPSRKKKSVTKRRPEPEPDEEEEEPDDEDLDDEDLDEEEDEEEDDLDDEDLDEEEDEDLDEEEEDDDPDEDDDLDEDEDDEEEDEEDEEDDDPPPRRKPKPRPAAKPKPKPKRKK